MELEEAVLGSSREDAPFPVPEEREDGWVRREAERNVRQDPRERLHPLALESEDASVGACLDDAVGVRHDAADG